MSTGKLYRFVPAPEKPKISDLYCCMVQTNRGEIELQIVAYLNRYSDWSLDEGMTVIEWLEELPEAEQKAIDELEKEVEELKEEIKKMADRA